MKCCVSTVCAIFQCDEFAGDINKKNCMHNLNVVRESFRTQNERKRQMKRDQRNWKMIIISFFSRFLLLHIIIRTAQTFKNEDNAAAKLKWHEWKQSQRNKHKCIVQCTYLYHFGWAERRSANCIAIFRRLFGSMQHFADVHSLFWSFWMHSIQTHDFFSFFQFHFYTERKYTNHISNILLRCRVWVNVRICLQPKPQPNRRKKVCSKLTIIIRCLSALVFEYVRKCPTMLKETDKIGFSTFCRDLNSKTARPSAAQVQHQHNQRKGTNQHVCIEYVSRMVDDADDP